LKKYSDNANYTTYLTSYDSDGLVINGLLTIPKTDGPHPAIVFVHGYIAPSAYKTTEKYGDYVNYLARNGFVVFKIDLRGNGESEGEPGGAYYSGDYVIDTLNAYSALERAEFVDPKRIGLWGHSMAGNVTFRSMVAKRDIPAVVIWAGAGYTYRDLLTYRISDNSYRPPQTSTNLSNRRAKLRELYGEFDENNEFWQKVAPTNYLGGLTSAIQINHAVDDKVVSIEYSRNLMKVLDSTNIVHELNEYPSGGHNISGNTFSQAMKATVEFYLKQMVK
jgi:dipeptidyl aminopeptidase/acylaminoacyl peptidase